MINNQITIENDKLKLRVDPNLGGSFLEFSAKVGGRWFEVMRHCPDYIKSSSDTASFLMAPYPNRIRDGKFTFEGKSYQLKYPEKHAIHGDVRNRVWKVEHQSAQSCIFSFDSKNFEDINYPFPFAMQQKFTVEDNLLKVECLIKNCGETRMPAGCGFHPYFNRALNDSEENVMLMFKVAGVYPFSGDLPLPEGMMQPLDPSCNFSQLRGLDVVLDHCFGGWQEPAIIYWPRSAIKLEMEASSNMSHLVVYSPKGEPFFAFEPQSQMIDGINFLSKDQDQSGVVVLSPKEELRVWFNLKISQDR